MVLNIPCKKLKLKVYQKMKQVIFLEIVQKENRKKLKLKILLFLETDKKKTVLKEENNNQKFESQHC